MQIQMKNGEYGCKNHMEKSFHLEHKREERQLIHSDLGGPAFSFTVVNGIHKSTVVPVFNDIVWSVMNLYFDSIASIVDEKYDASLSTSYHR